MGHGPSEAADRRGAPSRAITKAVQKGDRWFGIVVMRGVVRRRNEP